MEKWQTGPALERAEAQWSRPMWPKLKTNLIRHHFNIIRMLPTVRERKRRRGIGVSAFSISCVGFVSSRKPIQTKLWFVFEHHTFRSLNSDFSFSSLHTRIASSINGEDHDQALQRRALFRSVPLPFFIGLLLLPCLEFCSSGLRVLIRVSFGWYGVDKRLEESKSIIAKYPDRVPVSSSPP